MAYFANASRRVVIRANRETIVLVLGACALTFAIAHGLHDRAPDAPAPTAVVAATPQQDWTGHLAEIPPTATTMAPVAEPLSSESLTVPKAQLALPAMPSKPKARPCDVGQPCSLAKVPAPVPPVRKQVASVVPVLPAPAEKEKERGLMATLNPLNHLPDMSTVKRPFAYAGDTVSGWFKRF